MRAKTKITYNRDGSVKKIVSNVGQTHHNRAAYELHRNNVQPTFGIRLRWFCHNVAKKIRTKRNKWKPLTGKQEAAAIKYIGIVEG